MDKITKINSGEKFTHTSVGKLAEFNGKQFLKDTVGTTGCEISFGTIYMHHDWARREHIWGDME